MKKKFNVLLIIMSILVITSACSAPKKTEQTVPKETVADETVIEFMEATKKLDIDTMISKIDPQNRDNMDDVSKLYKEGQKEENRYLLDYLKDNAEKITYTINNTTLEGDSAVVNVDVSYIDGAPLFKAVVADYMKNALSSAFTGQKLNQEETIKFIIASMKKQREIVEQPLIEKNIDIECVKRDNEWYIKRLNEDLSNVVTSNMLSTVKKLEKTFKSSFGKSITK